MKWHFVSKDEIIFITSTIDMALFKVSGSTGPHIRTRFGVKASLTA